MASNTDVVKKLYYNMSVLCFYLCLYDCCKHRPLNQNQIFKISITFYNARRQSSTKFKDGQAC